ncbi:alpha-amylase family glycosyl hydrolase [Streptomyces sp. SBT349]|uniref:alpha-amylase family glycosyl hydrolase n=1 Tax=Streptomyces sp. SBT349 TaxID=1580539 RepID=UPI00069D0E04|nr:alpha-amylase family glycosyl hydrolase [Streptomyces sp. SBT349]
MTWWADAVVYEVYVRSFADSDGDGVGDLAGVTARLPHLADLGVDALWITPFFPSPGRDHGYDVSDFTAVDPLFGDLAAFDALVERAHALGLRVLVDIVPNHTSDAHPWFMAALAEGRGGRRYRDYYIWRDPAPDGGPPNNWISNFGGPAWTRDPASGQYWMHAYLPEQPDLNWRSGAVRAEWERILGFWLARGVDGFRIDVAHNLLKHPDFPDNPPAAGPAAREARVGRARQAHGLARVFDIDQDGVVDVFRALRAALPNTTGGERPFLLGETVLDDPGRVARYVERDGLDAAMWFGAQAARFDARELHEALDAVAHAPGPGAVAWFLSNHDRSRPATRLGDADRALAVAAVVMAVPGPYLLYQGEEIGAEDLRVAAGEARDPLAVRAGEPEASRDRARAPMPWTVAGDRGFAAAPWLPHGPLPAAGSVAEQAADPGSHLARWRALIAALRALRGALPRAVVTERHGDLLVVRRGPLLAVANLGEADVPLSELPLSELPPPGLAGADAEMLWRSGRPGGDRALRAAETAWWRLAGRPEGGEGPG